MIIFVYSVMQKNTNQLGFSTVSVSRRKVLSFTIMLKLWSLYCTNYVQTTIEVVKQITISEDKLKALQLALKGFS
jgi:uncharacterized protein (DUF486 family)